MKRIFISISLFIFVFFSATLLTLYLQRNSRPAVICSSLDDSIRPRDYCLMNPFRDKQPEILAENLLRELKNGNLNALIPYLNNATEDEKNHFLENEKLYKIKNWRIGGREDSEDTIYLTFWVSRENYPDILEPVDFDFARESDEFKPRHFSAIY